MKLRIVEDPEGCGKNRWFKLERLDDGGRWCYVESGITMDPLEDKAKRLMASGLEPIVVKEFDSDPPAAEPRVDPPAQPLVDDDDIPF